MSGMREISGEGGSAAPASEAFYGGERVPGKDGGELAL